MKPTLVALLLMLLLPAEAFSGGAGWTGQRVAVLDYTSRVWDSILPTTVAEMNAMLPPEAPRLVYRRKPARDCRHLIPRRGAIIVCSQERMRAFGVTRVWLSRQRTLTKAKVRLRDTGMGSRRDARNTACHEVMHAITNIRDNPGAAPATSCVWGTRPTPGRRDAAFAAKVYAQGSERKTHGQRRRRR
jgi:hypothetical protein